MRKSNGFSLIDGLIVVAIIGIAAAVAIPTYFEYNIRKHVTDGLQLANSIKSSVEMAYMSSNSLPSNNDDAHVFPASQITSEYVQSVHVHGGGIITITYSGNGALGGKTLSLVPTPKENGLSWNCKRGSNAVPAEYVPSECNK